MIDQIFSHVNSAYNALHMKLTKNSIYIFNYFIFTGFDLESFFSQAVPDRVLGVWDSISCIWENHASYFHLVHSICFC